MASNLRLTVEEVLELMSDLRGESSTNTDAVRIRAVSRANQDFARRKFWSFYLLPAQTQVGDATNNYTIGDATNPYRLKGLAELFVGATADTYKTYEYERHTIVSPNKFKNLYNQNNAARLVYEWFDSANDNWKIHINPAPAATDTITYSFYWEPPELTATSDEIVCPDIRILALLALADIYAGEDEADLALDSKQEAEQLISEQFSIDNAPHVNQLYQMYATESSPNTNGIGNY